MNKNISIIGNEFASLFLFNIFLHCSFSRFMPGSFAGFIPGTILRLSAIYQGRFFQITHQTQRALLALLWVGGADGSARRHPVPCVGNRIMIEGDEQNMAEVWWNIGAHQVLIC